MFAIFDNFPYYDTLILKTAISSLINFMATSGKKGRPHRILF